METCALERVDMYGRPKDAVLARPWALPKRESPLTMIPGSAGYCRFR